MTTRTEILDVAQGLSLGPGPAALAVDVGGTGMKAAIFDESGALVDAVTAPTPDGNEDAATQVIEVIAGFQRDFSARYGKNSIAEAAVVVPGIVDEATGTGIYSANLGWRDVPFRSLLRDRLGLEVAVSHDVRSAGRAEFELTPTMPANAVLLTLGTGIAAAIRSDGCMLAAGGYAGEVGFTHVVVDTADGGYSGHAEHIASAAAIAKRYTERSGTQVAGSLDVLGAMHAGDEHAAAVFTEAIDALGVMCAQLVAILAPEAIVFGGGLSSADELLDGVEAALRSRLDFLPMPSIRRATLGPVAGLVGAGLLTRQNV